MSILNVLSLNKMIKIAFIATFLIVYFNCVSAQCKLTCTHNSQIDFKACKCICDPLFNGTCLTLKLLCVLCDMD